MICFLIASTLFSLLISNNIDGGVINVGTILHEIGYSTIKNKF